MWAKTHIQNVTLGWKVEEFPSGNLKQGQSALMKHRIDEIKTYVKISAEEILSP